MAAEEYKEKPRAHTQFWEYIQELSNAGLITTKVSGDPSGRKDDLHLIARYTGQGASGTPGGHAQPLDMVKSIYDVQQWLKRGKGCSRLLCTTRMLPSGHG